jgi:hypothetical protein
MKTLHIAPGYSARGSLIRAIRDAGREDDVLSFADDLSCGPIDSDAARPIWRRELYDAPEIDTAVADFWQRVAGAENRLVVWFGRHSAKELSFFLAWADRVQRRAYQIVDVTGVQPLLMGRENAARLSRLAQAASFQSAPIDYFDVSLMERATPKWQQIRLLVGNALAYNWKPYIQIGDLMLLTRVAALVDAGKLLAEGDPWQMSSHVRLPD